MKLKILLIILVGLILVVSGCGGSSSQTLATHDVDLPDGLAEHVPLPEDASIRMAMENQGTYMIMYRPGVSYPEAVDFFMEALPANDWIINEENIPDREEGERTASWSTERHGVKMRIELTAFGGVNGFNMTGIISIEEL